VCLSKKVLIDIRELHGLRLGLGLGPSYYLVIVMTKSTLGTGL